MSVQRLPWIQFWVDDWLQDVRMCSPATRGIYLDWLCVMHVRQSGGTVTGTIAQLARLGSCSAEEAAFAVTELEATKVADVTRQITDGHGIVVVTNRRMQREHTERFAARERKQKQRCHTVETPDVTLMSQACPASVPEPSQSPPVPPPYNPPPYAPPGEARDKKQERGSLPLPSKSEGDREIEPLATFPATLEAAIARSMATTNDREFIEIAWSKAMGRGGCDSKDVPIRSWAHHIATEWAYERQRRAKTAKGSATSQEGGKAAQHAPVWAQIKSTEELIKAVTNRLAKIHVPDSSLYPDQYAAAIRLRSPLVDEKAKLKARLEELHREQAKASDT